jgi:hypothetical protein
MQVRKMHLQFPQLILFVALLTAENDSLNDNDSCGAGVQ